MNMADKMKIFETLEYYEWNILRLAEEIVRLTSLAEQLIDKNKDLEDNDD